ncbi:CDP-alcohol phosphatidyltransferase family protein [Thermodesulfobacteriota bacterium]
MIKSLYTYLRIALTISLLVFIFLNTSTISTAFFVLLVIFIISSLLRKTIGEDKLTAFELRLNHFLDEFFVYGSVILLSLHGYAPLWVVVIYFYKDATIGAIRNFAIKMDLPLHEKHGYKIDKLVQYTVILFVSFIFCCYKQQTPIDPNTIAYVGYATVLSAAKYSHTAFYVSATISFMISILFFFMNKEFMKKIHNT